MRLWTSVGVNTYPSRGDPHEREVDAPRAGSQWVSSPGHEGTGRVESSLQVLNACDDALCGDPSIARTRPEISIRQRYLQIPLAGGSAT